MIVTILICTRNGRAKLEPTLQHLAALQVPAPLSGSELLLVDNGSTDGTAEFAREVWTATGSTMPLRVVPELRPGKGNALATGFNEARGELILTCDDDNWLRGDYLARAVAIMDQYPCVGLLGGYGASAIFPDDQKPSWFDRFQFHYVVGKHHPQSGILRADNFEIYGAGAVLRKKAWAKIRASGFYFRNSIKPGKALCEDVELAMAVTFAGYTLYFDDQLTFVHDLRWGRLSFGNLIAQEALNGKGQVHLLTYRLIHELHRGQGVSWAGFVRRYAGHWWRGLKHVRRLARTAAPDDLESQLLLAKNRSLLRHLVLLGPSVLLHFPRTRRWIVQASAAA